MVTESDLQRERYEAALKLERDRISFEKRMRRMVTEAREKGWARDWAEGLAEGREQGWAEGFAIGYLLGRLHACQKVLGHPRTPTADLLALPLEELQHRVQEIQQQLPRQKQTTVSA
jgi:flagellar biosynthesis/type III secretory pathway protein FliH